MYRQSAFFGTTNLQRSVILSNPSGPTRIRTRWVENEEALGGMRRPDLSVATNPLYASVGASLSLMLDGVIQRYPSALDVVRSLRRKEAVTGFSTEALEAVRTGWFECLGSSVRPSVKGPDPSILQAWGSATDDPDASTVLPTWLRTGAPIGVLEPIEVTGIFPSVLPETVGKDPFTLFSEQSEWSNYKSAEELPEVVADLLAVQETKGHCRSFASYEDALEYLGVDSLVLTRVALISKQKPDGSTKHRLIWDLLRSEVNSTVSLYERIVLPRVQDAVDDARELRRLHGDPIEWLVLDVADAFHNIPLRPSERRFTCGKFQDRVVVFESLCMGGKSAPNIWGRYAAAMGRILASIADPSRFRVEIFVDDPLMVASGDTISRDWTFTRALLALSVLGFPLAWGKGELGQEVVWIGAKLSNLNEGIRVSIPQDKLVVLQDQTALFSRSTVVSRRHVRSYCGRLSFIAGMVAAFAPIRANGLMCSVIDLHLAGEPYSRQAAQVCFGLARSFISGDLRPPGPYL